MTKVDKVTCDLAQYMIEITLLEYSSITEKPSLIAHASLFLASKILKTQNSWNAMLMETTKYSEEQLNSMAWEIFNFLKTYQRPQT